MADDLKHHFMASVTLQYKKRHIEGLLHNMNILLILDNIKITQHVIGHIQQNAQIRFIKLHDGAPDINITDIFINNIFPLGFMTQEEFLRKPEAPKPKDIQSALAEIVARGPTEPVPPRPAPTEPSKSEEPPMSNSEGASEPSIDPSPIDPILANLLARPQADISDCAQLGHKFEDGRCTRCGQADGLSTT